MKKYISIFILVAVALVALVAVQAKAESLVYSTSIDTNTLGQNGAVTHDKVGINKAVIKLKNIVIHQNGTVPQTVTFYKNWTTTTAATAFDTFYVPATAGNYYPYGQNILSQAAGNVDIINAPYFTVRTSSDNCGAITGRPTISVLYNIQ